MTDQIGNPNFPENQEYWQAVQEGRLLLKRCDSCSKPHYYPRAYCPFCAGTTHWEESQGKGEIYSFTVVRNASPPYCPAYVTLDEGPTMLALMADCDFDSLNIGDRVSVLFRPGVGGQLVPMFTPIT